MKKKTSQLICATDRSLFNRFHHFFHLFTFFCFDFHICVHLFQIKITIPLAIHKKSLLLVLEIFHFELEIISNADWHIPIVNKPPNVDLSEKVTRIIKTSILAMFCCCFSIISHSQKMINLTQIGKYVGENSNFIIIFFVVVVLVIVIVGDFSLKM